MDRKYGSIWIASKLDMRGNWHTCGMDLFVLLINVAIMQYDWRLRDVIQTIPVVHVSNLKPVRVFPARPAHVAECGGSGSSRFR